MTAPALALPDPKKPYDLFVHEWAGGAHTHIRIMEVACGLLFQTVGHSGKWVAPMLELLMPL